jgi:hypothetical protein
MYKDENKHMCVTTCVQEYVEFSPTSEIDGEVAQHKGGGSPHASS